jgi:23S rRNA (pseudouridine1915-N3)-methyltransferase
VEQRRCRTRGGLSRLSLSIEIVAGGRAKSAPETEMALAYLARAREAGRSLGFSSFALREADERKDAAFAFEGLGVALDERGKSLGSIAFAQQMAAWRDAGEPRVSFLIGGSDGLPESVRKQARTTIALGVQTWPHLLVRTMLAEQIYRAVTILSGHPYHRA